MEIVGDRPKGWKSLFEHTVVMLGGGNWGDVTLKSGTVSVGGVREGDESTVQHFLEGVMQQANTTHPEVGDDEDEDEDEGQEPESESESDEDVDARMTDRFRELGPD